MQGPPPYMTYVAEQPRGRGAAITNSQKALAFCFHVSPFIYIQWNLDLRACKIRANPDLRAIFVPTIFLLSKNTSK